MSYPKVLLYDFEGEKSLSESFRQKLKTRAAELEILEVECDYSGELNPEYLEGIDVLVSRVFEHYNKKIFRESDLDFIAVMATDKSHYPLDFLEQQGIQIANAPNYARESVAELTMNMMLQLSLNTYKTNNFVESGNWDVGPFPGRELKGKKLGIIGLGSIGSRVAKMAEAFDMEVLYYGRSKKDFAEERGWNFVNLDELVKRSDIISIHCSLNEETRDMLDDKLLENVEQNTLILNAARSEVQDIEKTIQLCEEDRMKVWLDALENPEERQRLLETGNAVLTSHSGCATEEAKQRLKSQTLENLDKFMEGR